MNSFNEFLETIKMGYFKNQYNILKYHSNYLSMYDEFGLNVIHWVCLLNNVDILQILLNENCDIEARGKNGWRAIHFATFMGHTDIVKRLIETYCEIDCKTDNNETPLDIANGKSNHEFIDKIFYKTTCLKIALKMGFKCGSYCEHRYCLITTLSDIKMDPKISKLGKGTFGKIYQIGDNFNEKTFACKRMKKTKLFKKKWKNNILPCINDYLWPSMINHAKILTYYGSLEIGDRILLIMEHMQKGSIEDIIKSKELLSETKILQYTKDILQGLAFLHKQNIIHRRVKPSHMLINERDECKLSISSLSRLLVHEDIDEEFNLKDISPGTLNFLAPEIINGENYNLPVDIWSLGCSLINILTGYPPYYQFNEYQLCFLIGTVKKIEFEVHSSISDGLKCLIGKMLNAEIEQRLTVKNLLMSLLFKNLSNIEFDQSNNAVLGVEFNLNTDKEPCKKIIQYAIDNQEAGKVMGFMCAGRDCNHKLCLSSVTATNFKKDKVNKGGYGTVYKSAESNSNRVFAIKRLDCATNDDIRYVENKIDKYKHLINHDRIIKYYGAIKNDKYFFIFMKYMEHGSLTDEIKKMGGFLSEETIKKFSKQILEGVAYLHSNNICHRDIKSDNILINELGNIEIADFGFSRIFTPESIFSPKSMCGTKCYMSPEMRCGENYNFETDIWSVGATVYEMFTGKTPCMETTPNFLFKNQLSFVINYPDNLSKKVKQFLDLMLQCNPKKRATATELLGNKFLNTSFNKKKSLRRYFCIFKK